MKHHINRAWWILLLVLWGCGSDNAPRPGELRWLNLAHLNHLYEEVVIDGQPMAIIHIYSEYPDYGWVAAAGEGIACVDDAARAAVVYLRHYEVIGDTASLGRARNLVEFCRFMQADDGQFYNFIFADHSINREGKTSYKSLGWWAARGIWALGEGFRVFRKHDPGYAEQLADHIRRTFSHIDTLLQRYPTVGSYEGFPVPRWLLYNSAADATSELLLGLIAYGEAAGDDRVRRYVERFADGLVRMQLGDEQRYPYGLFLSWKNVWHGWGNSQAQALTRAAGWLGDEAARAAGLLEVRAFYPYWMESGFPRALTFAREDTIHATEVKRFSQIAYAVRPAVLASLQAHALTGNAAYAEQAGRLVAWFFGNNPARQRMYDPATGRCFDGIISETKVNRNAGAESTIEALYAILEVEANPIARETLQAWMNK